MNLSDMVKVESHDYGDQLVIWQVKEAEDNKCLGNWQEIMTFIN